MLVMQTKHGFIIGNKYVFLNFKAQGKEVLFIQSINHSNKKVLIFQSNFFFFLSFRKWPQKWDKLLWYWSTTECNALMKNCLLINNNYRDNLWFKSMYVRSLGRCFPTMYISIILSNRIMYFSWIVRMFGKVSPLWFWIVP